MGTVFFASYLIGLRDGLEASLVVSILVAFLRTQTDTAQTGSTQPGDPARGRLRQVWGGVGAAVLVSAAVGVLLTTVAGWLGSGTRMELFEAVTSLTAVALVTWMIFWMRRSARTLRGELTGRLSDAIAMGGWAVATMAFFAVLREGVEMVLLVFAAAEGAADSAAPLAGMVLGIATAVALGWVIARATVRINLGRFFTWTGVLLILVAAGILKYGVHGLQSAGVLPGGNRDAFDLTTVIDPTSWYATLLAGTVNLTPRATALEITAWLAFAFVMLALFFRPAPRPATATGGKAHGLAAIAAVAVLAGLTPGGCGAPAAQPGGAPEAGRISVAATDTTCTLSTDHTGGGTTTFTVDNKGTKVTELYVYGAAERVLGEVENVAPGVSRELRVDLTPGTYTVACKPGMIGAGIRSTLTVTGSAPPPATAAAAALAAAAEGYHRYVRSQADAFVEQTRQFVDAVKAGRRDQAQTLFPTARTPYERIETVAETFGDLDPRIDARDGDLDPGVEWTGYHRIEQQLWNGGDLAAVAPLADRLLADVEALRQRLDTVTLTPLELANGAKGLLDEVATKKVTGEEDRYSHTDLWDFAANVDGCRAALAALRPVLDARRPELGPQLDARFAAVDAELARYRTGDRYQPYTVLQPPQVQLLAGTVNALAEQVAAVPPVIAGR
ncbi:iron uptake system protein EfeO [Dactylosporangium sp. AC04546]|uniref:iron uptake system protein EfeO n=1 Tax=Dactylosporangium sp. AC04546 TaxID=2862460 RepID=UPI0027E05F1B|nr:iron uptake system protein EfeO [Dactylosporangium sp. AC04546]WVK88718.1 iron uptake system protein EfeO [Dactylosporangium sp. AC04546]